MNPFLLIAAREQTTYLYYHSNLSLLNRSNIPYYPSSQLILLNYIIPNSQVILLMSLLVFVTSMNEGSQQRERGPIKLSLLLLS